MTNKGKGQRALMWLRANAAGAAKSLEEQEEAIRRFAEEHGLEIVGSVGGVFSGGNEAEVNRHIDEVIERKRNSDGFSMLLMQDAPRLSRLGATKTAEMVDRLRREGIVVQTTVDAAMMIEGASRGMLKGVGRCLSNSIDAGSRFGAVMRRLGPSSRGSWRSA